MAVFFGILICRLGHYLLRSKLPSLLLEGVQLTELCLSSSGSRSFSRIVREQRASCQCWLSTRIRMIVPTGGPTDSGSTRRSIRAQENQKQPIRRNSSLLVREQGNERSEQRSPSCTNIGLLIVIIIEQATDKAWATTSGSTNAVPHRITQEVVELPAHAQVASTHTGTPQSPKFSEACTEATSFKIPV